MFRDIDGYHWRFLEFEEAEMSAGYVLLGWDDSSCHAVCKYQKAPRAAVGLHL
jgi:hypothetical protein